jgi:SAM-dependent methyltransferase
MTMRTETKCFVCGGLEFSTIDVIWSKLATDWQLSPSEIMYVNRQQGACCTACGTNLRSGALARAISIAIGSPEEHLSALLSRRALQDIKILEINGAGNLSGHLQQLPNNTLRHYPDVDMMAIDLPSGTFDLVLHSDTLEHIEHPVRALAECRRLLAPGGACCFTVPIIIGRMSRSRAGLSASYHGNSATTSDDLRVHWEFGADIWVQVMQAGFSSVTFVSSEHPAAHAIVAR